MFFASTLPLRADFKYTETSKVTGGALVGMLKFASVFARVDAKKQERQRNSDALKGLPLLSYISMTMAIPSGTSQSGDRQQPSNPPPSDTGNSSAGSSIPDSPSAAVMKGLGGLLGRKKQQDKSSQSDSGSSNQTNSPPPNSNANPNALIEITTQVNSYSDSSLDSSLFDIPMGYTQIQEDPAQILNGAQTPKSQTPK